MNNKVFRFSKWPHSKIILFSLAAVITTQLILVIFFSQKNTSAQFKVNRDIIAREVINLIQTVENKPIAIQESFVNDLNIPNFSISIDTKPKYSQQFKNESLWNILIKISEQKPDIKLSFFLVSGKWFNIEASIGPSSWHYQIILLILEISVTSVILFFLWNMNRFTGPLKNFTDAADRLGVNLQTEPLPIYGPASVRATANAMNKMQERISDLIAARTQMLAAISHDLRTPITRMKLRAQFVADEDLQRKMIADLDEMEAMIAETLSFAHADANKEKHVNLDLVSLLAALCDDYAEAGMPVVYHSIYQRVPYLGSMLALKRLFSNLIENAVKYGQEAAVTIHKLEEEILIEVTDKGPGLPAEEISKVFLPFYREQSRSRETGGTGLGLAVAKDIARAHGGEINLLNCKNGGLLARVILPIINS